MTAASPVGARRFGARCAAHRGLDGAGLDGREASDAPSDVVLATNRSIIHPVVLLRRLDPTAAAPLPASRRSACIALRRLPTTSASVVAIPGPLLAAAPPPPALAPLPAPAVLLLLADR